MSTISPRVRDACETCHKRKIRCLLEPGSTACQSCSISGSSCLFAPRAKAGRPRRAGSHAQQRRKLSWTQMREKTSIAHDGAGHHRSNSDSLVMVATDEMHYNTVLPFDHYWDPEKMVDMHVLRGSDFLTEDQEARHPQQAVSQAPISIDVHEIAQQQQQQQHQQQQDIATKQDSILGMLTPSRSSTPPFFENFTTTDESLDFDASLKLCGDLDRSYRSLRDNQISPKDVEEIIRMIEYACATARAAAFSASAEKASTALILASMYKVFDICETLVRQCINEGANPDWMERLFRMKRMDLALFQAYMFLNQMGQADAMKKVSELHAWMDSVLQQQQYQMIW